MANTSTSGADPAMVDKIANHLKSQGIFDQFRRDCLEDVDTKVSSLSLVPLRSLWPLQDFNFGRKNTRPQQAAASQAASEIWL